MASLGDGGEKRLGLGGGGGGGGGGLGEGGFWILYAVQFLDHGFASNVGSNGYNTRVAMSFYRFGW